MDRVLRRFSKCAPSCQEATRLSWIPWVAGWIPWKEVAESIRPCSLLPTPLLMASIPLPQDAMLDPKPAICLRKATVWPHPPGKDQTACLYE